MIKSMLKLYLFINVLFIKHIAKHIVESLKFRKAKFDIIFNATDLDKIDKLKLIVTRVL